MTVALTSTDNLALAAAIKDLQAQITTLKRNSMLLGPEQQGPRPGEASNLTLRASRILPPNFTGPYMELDLTQVPTNNTTRLSPALHVNDGTNERVQVGNLGPNGISPAQYGLRVNDASGNPIFDSLGLIAVMKTLGTASGSGTSLPTGVTSWQPSGTTVTFTLSRQITVLFLITMDTQLTPVGAVGTCFAQYTLDGIATNVGRAVYGNNTAYNPNLSATGFSVDVLAGGSHTYQASWQSLAATDFINGSWHLSAFSLGS